MRIVVCGSLTYRDKLTIHRFLSREFPGAGHVLVAGDVPGATDTALEVANDLGWSRVVIPAKVLQYGFAAIKVMCREVLEVGPDMVVRFGHGYVADTIFGIAQRLGIVVYDVEAR